MLIALALAVSTSVAVAIAVGLSTDRAAPVSAKVADYYEKNKDAKPTEAPEMTVAAYLGDSWTSNGPVGVPALTSRAFNWHNQPFGQGGTGYRNPGPAVNGVLPFPTRVDKVVAADPDIVFVLGGLNDRGPTYGDDAGMRQAAGALYDELKAKLPKTQLVVVGPYYPGENYPKDLLTVRDAVKAEAASRAIPFIDPIEGHWITGAPDQPGSGNAPDYIRKSHPNEAGQAHLSEKLVESIRKIPALAKFTAKS